MKALQTKKFVGQKSVSDAAIPVQSQIKSRPFVTNPALQRQELTQTPEEAKLQGFNFAQIPIFPGMRLAMPEMLQPKQAKETLKDLPEVNLAPSSGGQPMPKLVQQKMETSFGTNFSDVRIHEGSQAEKIGALAYTQGQNIHFQSGKYQPTTHSGQELLGHELAHVVQQRAGRVTAPQSKGVAINADSQLETEADVLGAKAARGESAQVTGAVSSGVQRMPAQGNVVQCMREGKQRADPPSDREEDDSADLVDEAGIDAVLEEYYTGILDEEISQASPKELAEIASERNSFLSPVAVQMLISSGGQEQAGSSTDAQRISQNSGNRQYIPEDLLDRDRQEGSSGVSNFQDVEEEDNRPLAEIFASIDNILGELESELPPDSELRNLAATTRQELSQGSAPRIPLHFKPRISQQTSPNRLQKRIIPPEIIESLVKMDERTRNRRLAELSQRFEHPVIESISEELTERDRQQQSPPIPVTEEQEDQQIHPPAPTRLPPPIPQQRQRPPIPLTPQQQAQYMLGLNNTQRAQRIAELRLQGRVGQHYIETTVNLLEELTQQQRQQNEIVRLEGRIPPQAPQTPQLPATRGQKITKGIRKGIGAPFNATSYVTGGPGKEPKKELAAGMKQHETYSDQTKILGQDSSNSNIDQIGLQNLPANAKDPLTSVTPLPEGTPKEFSHDAAIIGMTRDDVKAIGGLLLFSDNLKKFKKALKDKTKPRRERIADLSNSTGEMTSAVTYTGIVITQAQRGIQHHTEAGATFGSGAIAAVERGGKIGTLSSAQQGGFIGGTSLPFDIGKVASGVLTTLPKLITYTDAGLKAAEKENFGGHKSWGRGVKNVADLTKSAAGAVKDAASLANNAGAAGGAQGTQIIAGGAVAPAAAAVVGTAEAIQGGYKFKKAYKNKKGLDEIANSPTLDQSQILDQVETLNQLKEIQKKKMKRAAIKTTLGTVTLGAGVVGFTGGPPGLIAATAMGAGVGAFQIGQWGTRKLKQKMRDKGVKGFDNTKTTERKNEARKELAGNTLTILEGQTDDNEKDTLFSSIGLNGSKKDSAVQQVYNDVLARYLSPQELQQPTTTVNRILKLKGDKNNLKQEVSWERLHGNDFPPAFASLVKKAAIDKALKKR
ncbi:eCIS core domain-containing protein [Nostoc sp.]|uniref:eCIS core domain-containing protein n=1 Tax=Nostoc sp. TaxID=1180 RepID=UPI002FFC3B55